MVIRRLRDFLRRQSHNYRMMLVRSGGHTFFFNLTGNYDSIYTTSLGADPVTLGSMRGLSGAINMAISMPSGWLSDIYSLKKILGLGMAAYLLMVAMYAFALDWTWILVAMILSPFTMALMFRSQNVMISNGLRNEDRATGFGLRNIAAQVAGLISPIPAALLVERLGGLNAEGIRPLYYLRLAGLVALYVFVYTKLNDVPPQPRSSEGSFFQDFKEVLKGKEGLKAWIAVMCLGSLVWSMMEPFTFLYAAEVKGASALTLGTMTTISTLVSIIVSIPINRLADHRGRKASIYLIRPFLYVWMILVVVAPSPKWLVVAWVFRGIGMSSSAWDTLGLELVPAGQRGRWLGITNTLSSLFRIPAPIVGGILYKRGNPSLQFLIPLALDLGIRLPILALRVPETKSRTRAVIQDKRT
jgi:MFS family permease